MQNIFILNKNSFKNKGKKGRLLKDLYEERNVSRKGYDPEDIFHDPSKLLDELGYRKILDEEPIKFIRTTGTVWEFYLLRFSSIKPRAYSKLIKPIPAGEDRIDGSSRRQLGNPYGQWIQNYGKIEDKALERKVKPFVNKLIARKCPIRQQKGNDDFLKKRRKAAKAFFKYLLGRKITCKQLITLDRYVYIDDKLAYLVRHFPSDKQFIAAGLMVCLYGWKNENRVLVNLARQLIIALKKGRLQSELSVELERKLSYPKKQKEFNPPFRNIYHIGKRDRVNINFRVPTWLKLLNDTSDAYRENY